MLEKKEVAQLKAFAAEIRIGILEQLRAKGVGHAGGSMSIADVLAVTFTCILFSFQFKKALREM